MRIQRSRISQTIFAVSAIMFLNSTVILQDPDLEESIKRGEIIYKNHCITCHLDTGLGIPGVFPPLAKADFLLKNPGKSIDAIIYGMTGEITVNGQVYFGEMLPIKLNDQEIADVLNYARNSWGNEAGEIQEEDVAAQRKN